MYQLKREPWGLTVVFSGLLAPEELRTWLLESKELLRRPGEPDGFGVLLDMRRLGPLPAEGREVFREGQMLFRQAGLRRSCVIVERAMTRKQFTRLAKKNGFYDYERYVDTETHPHAWEETALNWIVKGLDPEEGTGA